jgi:hypothetical protein
MSPLFTILLLTALLGGNDLIAHKKADAQNRPLGMGENAAASRAADQNRGKLQIC